MPNSLSSILICSETADEVKNERLPASFTLPCLAIKKAFELPKFHKKT